MLRFTTRLVFLLVVATCVFMMFYSLQLSNSNDIHFLPIGGLHKSMQDASVVQEMRSMHAVRRESPISPSVAPWSPRRVSLSPQHRQTSYSHALGTVSNNSSVQNQDSPRIDGNVRSKRDRFRELWGRTMKNAPAPILTHSAPDDQIHPEPLNTPPSEVAEESNNLKVNLVRSDHATRIPEVTPTKSDLTHPSLTPVEVSPTSVDEINTIKYNIKKSRRKTNSLLLRDLIRYLDVFRSYPHFIPRSCEVPNYMKVPNAKVPGEVIGIKFQMTNAVRQCNEEGDECKAVVLDLVSNESEYFQLKASLGFPSRSASQSLYIKREFVPLFLEDLLKGSGLECAIPLDQSVSMATKVCKLPSLDPFHSSVMNYVEWQTPLFCPGKLYVKFENGRLAIDQDSLDQIKEVTAQPVRRPPHSNADFESELSENVALSKDRREATFQDDFLRVETELHNGDVQTDWLASIVEIPDVLERTSSTNAPLDIMILGFDSMSAAHFERIMPLTFKYLKNELKTFLFKGFSIVGQATTPAFTAMLTGLSVEENCERQEGRRGEPGATYIDGWPFIFKELKRQGLVTMWSEDDPTLGTFSLRLLGFEQQPTDHYGRTLWHLPERTFLCHGAQPQYEIQLKYLKSFMKSYKGRRKFGFTFLSDLCHQTTNLVGVADKGVATFVKSLYKEGLLDNTMFIMMGDHGPRFTESRSTTQGKLEESLPFLSVHFPMWFQLKYPSLMTNFRDNTEILISPFDLHATFLHLLNFPEGFTTRTPTHGTSLFGALPKRRTCTDARVPEHFCPCIDRRNISVIHTHAIEGAKLAVKEINRLITKDSTAAKLCEKILLVRTLDAVQVMPAWKVETFKEIEGGDGVGIGEVTFNGNLANGDCSYEIRFSTRKRSVRDFIYSISK